MSTKGTILLVEDNQDLRNGLRDILIHDGFEMLTAANGKQALTQLEQHTPDLIISDVSMPEMDGYELLDQVRAQPDGAPSPFIFLTAHCESEEVMQAHHLAMEDYLVKPISRAELLSIIHAKLNRFRQKQMARLEQSYETSLTILANVIEVRDQYLHGHIERVRDYSLLLARVMGLSAKKLWLVKFGAILHDVGKISVNENILLKAEPLSKEERLEIRRHPIAGVEILQQISYLSKVIPAVRHHHEHWDGNGYPDGLSGEAIPLEARIIAVADVFDAITTNRPYHPAWPFEKAAQEIVRGSGSYFDPAVIAAFEQVWQSGALIKLTTSTPE